MSLGPKPCSLVLPGLLLALLLAVPSGFAKDKEVRIPLPKRSHATPVQNLNRDGVKALEKHDYEKAKKLFYQAYLLDPNDPFTLNNLGYVSELQGEIDRAQRFYALAAEQTSDARVDRSTNDQIVGKPVSVVAGKTDDVRVQVNRYNVEAISLLLKDRAPEADLLLHKALALDRHNPFTLNNLGYAQEKEGELEQALSFYSAAAATRASDPVVVTPHAGWRGKPIGEIAADNARNVRRIMNRTEGREARVARLNLRGVSAINRNERDKARGFFEQAYKLDPNDAFTLNNMGYLSEMDGDQETAKFYYEKALDANRSKARVEVATRKQAEGRQLATVADQSSGMVETSMQTQVEARRRRGGPVVLKRRDNTPVMEAAPAPSTAERPAPGPGNMTGGGAPAGGAAPGGPNPQPAGGTPVTPPSQPAQQPGWNPAAPTPSLPSVEPLPTAPPQPQQQQNPNVAPPVPPATQQIPPPTTGATPR